MCEYAMIKTGFVQEKIVRKIEKWNRDLKKIWSLELPGLLFTFTNKEGPCV